MLRLRLALIPIVAACLLFVGTSHSFAAGAGAVSVTQNFHNTTAQIVDVFPCSGNSSATYNITLTYNGVIHFTILTSGVGAGTGWFTLTQTGTFTATPTAPGSTLPSFTGHFSNWDGVNQNLKNFAATFILNISGSGSDGSTFSSHLLQHVTVTPTGATFSFGHLICA